MPADTYLDEILTFHRARAAADRRDVHALIATAEVAAGEPRGFASALSTRSGHEIAVIAEIKRRSPSKGDLDPGLDPAAVATQYADGGATCLSVLTDEPHFAGAPADLVSARAACALPVLRKDFTVSEADVCDARIMGADAVLLIVAALSDAQLVALSTLAQELSLDALVEVHDEADLDRALEAGATLIGVNQRDLRSFAVATRRALDLAPHLPPEVVAVAESGITGRDDLRALADAGYQGALVGELLIKAPDRRQAVTELTGLPVGSRAAART